MGVIRKIVLSLLLVANLAHGQLSVDLNRAPLQHQGKIEQQYPAGNIDRSYGDAPGQPLDENIETIYVSPEGRSNYRPNYLRRTGSQDPTTNLKNLRRSTGLRRTDYDYDSDCDNFECNVIIPILEELAYSYENSLSAPPPVTPLPSLDASKSNNPVECAGFFGGLFCVIKTILTVIFFGFLAGGAIAVIG